MSKKDQIIELLKDPESKQIIEKLMDNESIERRLKELENEISKKRRELDKLVCEFRELAKKCPHSKTKLIPHDRPEGHEYQCLTCRKYI